MYSNNSYRNRGRFNNNRRGGNNYSSQGSRQSQSYNSNNGTNSSCQNIPNEVTSNSDNSENDISERAYPIKNYTKVRKINDHIVYINPELNTREKVVIISRASKATGKK